MNIYTTLLLCLFAGAMSQQYQLVWSDEFNGNALDRGKWQYEANCDGGGNNEMQCYTTSGDNVAVRNGSLELRARIQAGARGKQYSSGRINTRHAAAWKYGRFEARIKLPDGIYLWPAFWMMPKDSVYGGWASSGEIDIMEHKGGNTRDHSSALHYGGSWPKNTHQGSGSRFHAQDLSRDYHIYSATWTPDAIQFFVDGNNFYTMTLKRSFNNAGANSFPYSKDGQPFDQQFYLILNLAIGGGFFGGNSQALTQAQARAWRDPTLYVDYVRVYQQTSGGVTPNPVPAPAPTSRTPTPTPAPTQSGNNNAGGCAAGACGGAPCCHDQNAGQQCYNTNAHACVTDVFSQRSALCPKNHSACKGACFSPNQYKCTNGRLSPK